MGFFNEFRSELGKGAGRGVSRVTGDSYNVFFAFLRWLVSWKAGDEKEGMLQKNTFRIAIISLIIGLLTLGTCSFSGPQKTLREHRGVVGVVPNLTYGSPPPIPGEKKFAPTYDAGTQVFFETEGVTYFRFRRTSDGSTTQVTIPTNTATCVLVPVREKIGLATSVPPRYVVNMENTLSYTTKASNLSFLEKVALFFPDKETVIGKKGTWEDVRKNWQKVETTNFVLVAKALDRTPGGLVCF